MPLRCALLTLCLLLASGALGKNSVVELSPFTKIINCVPLSVSVRPRTLKDGHDYGLRFEGDVSQVQDALHYDVKDGTLTLSLSGTVSSKSAPKLTVFLPDSKLEVIENRGAAVLVVNSGFDVKSVGVKASPGKIRVDHIFADKIFAETKGIGMVTVHGVVQKAVLDADDISTIAIKGVQRKAHVNAAGTSKIYIMGEKGKRIDGKVHWLGRVFADPSESCTLDSEETFSGGCKRLIKDEVPVIEEPGSDHLEFVGDAVCSEDGSSRASTAQVHKSADGRYVSASASSHSSSRAASHSSSYASSSASASTRGSSYSSSSVSVHTSSSSSSGKPHEDVVIIT